MNFLAHIYLSGDNKLITLGNFGADSIKGKQYAKYPEEFQVGVLLHRQIDSFTDSHPIVRQSTKRLHSKYGHYSGIIVDIFYDHFLAKNWSEYHNSNLSDFVSDFYQTLLRHQDIMPERIQQMTPFLIQDNWLLSYAKTSGIATVLTNMNRRTGYKSNMNKAIEDLQLHYSEFETEFRTYFTELIAFADQKLKELTLEILLND
ncbi:MAG: ACP phosphodiesterase [Bacteroidetes bacterium MedPE-SWsnd-G2]|nr:MAG: ACP phosphodiesterase [Bacteroidetes bacterium MedPE-SWsnd-G2]